MADVQSPLPIPSTSTTNELSADEERARRRLVYDVVTQNLKALGAVSLEEYLASDSVGETSTSKSFIIFITIGHNSIEDDDDGEVANLSRAAQDGTVNISVADDVPTEARPDSAVVSNSKYKFSDTGDEDEATHPCVFEMSEMIVVGSNGTVTPYWLAIKDPKNTGLWGCAFRVQVSDKEWRVWSVDTTYNDAAEAQIACCQLYQEDILEYLKRTASCILPWATCYSSEPVPDELQEEPTWTVQQYFETLPRPFPEDVGDKTANEINAPSWFNSMLQISRGSRLVANFIWTESTTHGCKGLHYHWCRFTCSRHFFVTSLQCMDVFYD
ncbi:hypothetical protein QCA50_015065 [Cerrena zonata]|uniref:Uncharacterized protein n=1 Tax=Cerrena zonata TaxID=2478898 RepID=A0AAW0FKR8_9APHY